MDLLTPSLNHLIDAWLDEDLGRGDLSAIAIQNDIVQAHWIAKQKGIFCGGLVVEHLFKRIDQNIELQLLVNDGEGFTTGQKLLKLQGRARSLLAGERTALNVAMHLSGIATTTSKLVAELKNFQVQLADTRKTTPGLRVLEKYATRCGGGINHRQGLDDAAMLKENHIAWLDGDISAGIHKIKSNSPWPAKIIVEAETATQAEQAVIGGADGVLLDELPPEEVLKLVPKLRNLAALRKQEKNCNQIVIEVSGVDPSNLKAYASTGIDLISSSAPITKSSWIDFSMRYE